MSRNREALSPTKQNNTDVIVESLPTKPESAKRATRHRRSLSTSGKSGAIPPIDYDILKGIDIRKPPKDIRSHEADDVNKVFILGDLHGRKLTYLHRAYQLGLIEMSPGDYQTFANIYQNIRSPYDLVESYRAAGYDLNDKDTIDKLAQKIRKNNDQLKLLRDIIAKTKIKNVDLTLLQAGDEIGDRDEITDELFFDIFEDWIKKSVKLKLTASNHGLETAFAIMDDFKGLDVFFEILKKLPPNTDLDDPDGEAFAASSRIAVLVPYSSFTASLLSLYYSIKFDEDPDARKKKIKEQFLQYYLPHLNIVHALRDAKNNNMVYLTHALNFPHENDPNPFIFKLFDLFQIQYDRDNPKSICYAERVLNSVFRECIKDDKLREWLSGQFNDHSSVLHSTVMNRMKGISKLSNQNNTVGYAAGHHSRPDFNIDEASKENCFLVDNIFAQRDFEPGNLPEAIVKESETPLKSAEEKKSRDEIREETVSRNVESIIKSLRSTIAPGDNSSTVDQVSSSGIGEHGLFKPSASPKRKRRATLVCSSSVKAGKSHSKVGEAVYEESESKKQLFTGEPTEDERDDATEVTRASEAGDQLNRTVPKI